MELPLNVNIKPRKRRSGLFPKYCILFRDVKIHAARVASKEVRAGAPALSAEAGRWDWSTLGKSLVGGDEDEASLITAVHSRRARQWA